MTDDPWKDIAPPTEDNRISARRVPKTGSHAWGLYWAVDDQRHCLLILQHQSESWSSSHRLPKLRGLRVEILPNEDSIGERVVIRLTDEEQRAVFHRFCVDIVDATHPAQSEAEAVERFLVRTWRWHRLLRGGGDGRLSQEEQKGLIGELCVLERHLLPVVGPAEAVQAWVGPMDAPKDFHVGQVAVEAKTRSPHVPAVRISSAEQLDVSGDTRLFLHVTEVSEASSEHSSSVTITDIATRVRDSIVALDIFAATHFEERLSATGFDWNDDYSDSPWMIGDESVFDVRENFPRITPEMYPAGVKDLHYTITLSRCEGFRVEMTTLAEAIAGEDDGC